MKLFEQWRDLIENQTDETFKDFWTEYSGAETKIYSAILDNPGEKVTGKIGELASTQDVRPIIYMGFLDGINSSLKGGEIALEDLDENSEIELDIDLEKLFYNMIAAEAEYLYTLPQWNDILTEEKQIEIVKAFKRSKTVVKGKKIGRNDPCPCGSGKKYKKCCGR